MDWKIGEAKQQLSDLVRRSSEEPQILFNRDRPVAAVINVAEFRQFVAWQTSRSKRPLVDALAEAQRICQEEDYSFEVPARADRPNPLVEEAPRVSRRHQHRK
jgi:prevent-host-death family protein